MKRLLLILVATLTLSSPLFAKGEYDAKLQQLTGEIAAFTVGTSDATFESCTYNEGMITFVINPASKIGQYRLADPFAENFYETILAKMFGGNPTQGLQIMDFLVGTKTNFCFKIKPAGQPDYMESTVWPGSVKPLLQKLLEK